ncbi:MAG: tRNA 2-thiouridine(34) synthase MnmA [Planctomycetaceae bacterium]|jgi:tRNA-specific 2-thiouridylase|nr:tRNA 2-thiouridine(34) synthase MnmA [Planctomycetaceae bacterium]
MKPILTAMSGGVDSSTAAWKLIQEGYECQGATMKLFVPEEIGYAGFKPTAVPDAQKVCKQLGIKHHTVELIEEFKRLVLDRFAQTYLEGKTPNPCVFCNKHIKFGHLLQRAKEFGCGSLATGHYARIESSTADGRYLLRKAADSTKDQSYVLYSLSQEQLSQIRFPLGNQTKVETRRIAEQAGLAAAKKEESQDLCFVPDGMYADLIEHYLHKVCPPGDFVDKTGKILGQHKGIIRYTVGQRKGLGVAAKAPYYVCSHNVTENQIVLASEADLEKKYLTAHSINFIPFDTITGTLHCKAKVRYRQPEKWASVTQTGDNSIRVDFDEPETAVARGQSVVLYDGDYILGGGIID